MLEPERAEAQPTGEAYGYGRQHAQPGGDWFPPRDDTWREIDTLSFLNEQLKPILVGKYVDNEGNIHVLTRRLMNDEGASEVLSIVCLHVSPHVILGNLDDKEIKRRATDCGIDVLDSLIDHHEKFEVELENVPKIAAAFQDFVEGVLSRAKGGTEREVTAPNKRVIVNRLITDAVKEKKGVFEGFLQ